MILAIASGKGGSIQIEMPKQHLLLSSGIGGGQPLTLDASVVPPGATIAAHLDSHPGTVQQME